MHVNGITSVFGKYTEGNEQPIFPEKFAYAQVIKNFKRGEIGKVERRCVIGSESLIQKHLDNSEVSQKINTSFVERINLFFPIPATLWAGDNMVIALKGEHKAFLSCQNILGISLHITTSAYLTPVLKRYQGSNPIEYTPAITKRIWKFEEPLKFPL